MELVTGKPPVGLAPGRCAHRPAALLMQYGCCNTAAATRLLQQRGFGLPMAESGEAVGR
jgi:hypothetical protein